MIQKLEKIWLDGALVDWDLANVHILTHTLHYGLGVFEGIRCYQTTNGRSAILRLNDHLTRLYESAHIFMIEIPFAKAALADACVELLKTNGLEEGYVRPLVFVGDGEMGLHATDNPIRVAIIAWSWGTYLGEEGILKGIRAKISSYQRLAINVNLPKGKVCGNYINSILAKREAMLAGYDEAILLDAEGYVAEASGENIFMVKNNIVYTPPLSSSILRGITRDCILAILADNHILIREERFTREMAYTADELFLTGTAAEICPVRELDNRTIGQGHPGPITTKLQKIYFEAIRGSVAKYSSWLTII